ncbi:hypothetical protein SAMN05444266_10466 [Chitinophaga jiangningensis]|uniref:Uncharacterized protein n=1 Tax=Chitinophaga jiangningensis TaxID=1419482 RepID=A0A1M7BTX1_9BACT|nr:hypothetical protein [Chitinophaga jiangningensis]SHL58430.1 hypothetical protein SAMN05444266_10466 [Chitinophaga jiangningensis]
MKIISRYLVICLAILCWGCSAEMVRDGSFTLNPNEYQNASGTLKGSDNQCLQTAITGTFATKDAQTGAAFVVANVNVLVPGTYAISTDKQNGVTFAATGKFTATGIQQIKLMPVGIFEQAVITNYTLSFGNSSCPLAINVTEGTGAGNPGTGNPGTGNPGTGNPGTATGSYSLTINGKTYTSQLAIYQINTAGDLVSITGVGMQSGTTNAYTLELSLPLTNGTVAVQTYKSTDYGPRCAFSYSLATTGDVAYQTQASNGAITTYQVTAYANNTLNITISGQTVAADGTKVNISGTISAKGV